MRSQPQEQGIKENEERHARLSFQGIFGYERKQDNDKERPVQVLQAVS